MRSAILAVLLVLSAFQHALGQSGPPRFLEPGVALGLPRVIPNDNRTPAGTISDGVLDLNLEVVWADWRIETPDGPGLRVAAIAVSGGPPMIPAPLIRVATGT